jgi:hypothetical protein
MEILTRDDSLFMGALSCLKVTFLLLRHDYLEIDVKMIVESFFYIFLFEATILFQSIYLLFS